VRGPAAIIFVAAIALIAAAGCERSARFHLSEIGSELIQIRTADATIAHGKVGVGRHEGRGTFALVDAVNPLPVALDVSLAGDLLDANGAPVARLNPESVRIPARGQRTFALVHHLREVPEAVAVSVRVHDSRATLHPAPISVSDEHVYRDGDRVVVAANLHNEADRQAIVLVAAGFYDRDGRIMKRPFSVLKIGADRTHPARFVGPDGSASGYLFVVDHSF